jgi:hypothetical protein
MEGYEKETGYHFIDDEEDHQLEPKVKSCPFQEEEFDEDE